MLEALFRDSVEEAINDSIKEGVVLAVYNTARDDQWLKSWFKGDDVSLDTLAEHSIWLRLVKDTEQFQLFEQVFPNVVVPSIYLIRAGKIELIIQGEDDRHWEKLLACIGIKDKKAGESSSRETNPGLAREEKSSRDVHRKNARERIAETTLEIQRREQLKQRKLAEEERERIIRLVRADRAERKALDETHHRTLDDDKPLDVHDYIKDAQKLHSSKCVLQIRMTDGKTLKHEFNSSETLNDVRKWVDLNRTDGDCPYSFHRGIPRVTFKDSDELKTLETLELTPRSALLLKPLETQNSGLSVTGMEGPSLLGRLYKGFSTWWHNDKDPEVTSQREETSKPNRHEVRSSTPLSGAASSSCFQYNNVREPVQSSAHASPMLTPSGTRYPSETNLTTSRSVSPNVFQFVNNDHQEDPEDPTTFNGNNVHLEKKKDEDKK
ncbi:CRE_collapsed_G0004570.mRNA.1.CDS.1 [Saccharomyces cerevisiae]|nr:CRE_HP_G0034540.mRNA.1.CDS.1 [Saccharomyces cerevisiae]CAI4953052.1 CRE_HP_G0038400.mRNA.1.CDS.1 [Saccharomyces cerevisiae]CAI5044954.1 CRE_HP_G0108660.mRNA.1.CDS.1 [Saccharomyces cerevisiae]CAI6590097.1 CRE_HP_G0034540.mRNA.1.CDS.1 [Saccharomyces cerevisiae]CAI6625978.1 CRE_HP_G0038400.mRNA.1.CDS.1 [Saccharomyces cerevisiae]